MNAETGGEPTMKTVDKTPEKPLCMPAPEPNGFIQTLNKMGYMTSTLDRFSQAFVDFAPKAPGRALDIGAAYGVAASLALYARTMDTRLRRHGPDP